MGLKGFTAAASLVLAMVSASAGASAFPQAAPQADGKGTIGLVCLDPAGQPHYWNSTVHTGNNRSDSRSDFEACIDEVVDGWVMQSNSLEAAACDYSPKPTEVSSPVASPSFDSLIQGMSVYHRSLMRAQAAFKQKGN